MMSLITLSPRAPSPSKRPGKGFRRSTRKRLPTQAPPPSPSHVLFLNQDAKKKDNDDSNMEPLSTKKRRVSLPKRTPAKSRKRTAPPEITPSPYPLTEQPRSSKIVEVKRRRRSSSSSSTATCSRRCDNSLGTLTQRFFKLLKNAPEQRLELNKAVDELEVQKRRIYDATNVLEGIGLIKKGEKNVILLEKEVTLLNVAADPRSLLCPPRENSSRSKKAEDKELREKINVAQQEQNRLKKEEAQLDEWIGKLESTQDGHPSEQMHLTCKRLQELISKEETALALYTPKGTVLSVPSQDRDKNKHSFTATQPPMEELDEEETDEEGRPVVRAYLWQGNQSPSEVKEISFDPSPLTPSPPLLASCCSNFTVDALGKCGSLKTFESSKGQEETEHKPPLRQVSVMGTEAPPPPPLLTTCSSVGFFSIDSSLSGSANSKQKGSSSTKRQVTLSSVAPPPPPLLTACSSLGFFSMDSNSWDGPAIKPTSPTLASVSTNDKPSSVTFQDKPPPPPLFEECNSLMACTASSPPLFSSCSSEFTSHALATSTKSKSEDQGWMKLDDDDEPSSPAEQLPHHPMLFFPRHVSM